jgi:hypothetical protein
MLNAVGFRINVGRRLIAAVVRILKPAVGAVKTMNVVVLPKRVLNWASIAARSSMVVMER